MNFGMIRMLLGRLFFAVAFTFLVPLGVGLFYHEPIQNQIAFAVPFFVLLVAGILAIRKPVANDRYFIKEGFVMVALGWIFTSLAGSLPYLLIGRGIPFADAFFESSSGFSTTGASVFSASYNFPLSLLFWRCFCNFLGGLGMLIVVIVAMPRLGSEGVYVMKAELPGPTNSKLTSRVSSSIRIHYLIYIGLIVLLFLLLVILKIPLFDAFLLTFCIAGTGGFSIRETGLSYYANPAAETVIAVFMLLFGINFGLYFLLATGRLKKMFQSEEMRWYLGIIALSVAIISIDLAPRYQSFQKLIHDVFFTVTSTISTTAYEVTEISIWPVPSQVVLLLLMFCGAMAGSTAGGLKIYRVAIYIKTFFNELQLTVNPHRRTVLRFDGAKLNDQTHRSIVRYLITYLLVFALLMVLLSWDTPSFSTLFNVVLSTVSNTGHGLDLLGPAYDYGSFSSWSKIILSFGMIAGRLELYPLLILFIPRTWKKG